MNGTILSGFEGGAGAKYDSGFFGNAVEAKGNQDLDDFRTEDYEGV